MDFKRTDAEKRIYADFGQKHQETTAIAQRQNASPEQQQTAATRLALNHVLNQAATNGQKPSQLVPDARMVRAGQENMQQALGQKADIIVSALSGRTAGLELPKATTNSPDFMSLSRQGSQLAQDIAHDKIVNPARLELYGNGRRGEYLTNASGDHPDKERLVNHLLYARAGIDHAQRTGHIDSHQRATLEKKLEMNIFTPPSNQSLKPEFQQRLESGMKGLKGEVMSEVLKREQVIKPTIDAFYDRQKQAPKETTALTATPQDQAKIDAARKVFADKFSDKPPEVLKNYLERFDKQIQENMRQNGGKVNLPNPQAKSSPTPQQDKDQKHKRGLTH